MSDYILRKYRDANYKVLRPVRPNAGVEAAYRKRLYAIIEQMATSVTYWLTAAYRAHRPVMAGVAMDAVPANELRDAMAKLSRSWQHNFDELSDWLADYFAQDVADRSDAALRAALRKGGFTIGEFTLTRAMRDILNATVHENVGLIRSIPQKYLRDVEGMVMRSVQTGRDLGQLSSDLQTQLGVTKRRAALISRDQNNKCTSALQRARQLEMGIERAVWMHSHAGKRPRPTHVKMDGKTFDIKKGMYDSAEGEWVFPGTLINCRCTSRAVIPALA